MEIYETLVLWTFFSLTKTNATLIWNVNFSLRYPRFPWAYVIFETQQKEFNSHGVTLVHQHVLHFLSNSSLLTIFFESSLIMEILLLIYVF